MESIAKTGQRGQLDARYIFDTVTRDTEMLSAAQRIPIRGIRKIIFKNMHLSLAKQSQLTLHTEASAKELINLRHLFNARLTSENSFISYNAIIIKVAANT